MTKIDNSPKKILVIRRDNIGDMVLSTPFLHELRQRFPIARIDMLTNTYCAPVLDRNPDLDHVYVYAKGHHRGSRSLLNVQLARLRLILQLRRIGYDTIILGKPPVEPRPLQLARLVGAPRIVGITEPGSRFLKHLSDPVFWSPGQGHHIAERCMQLLKPMGGAAEAGKLHIFPEPRSVAAFTDKCLQRFGSEMKIIGIQISSRKPRQRWPIEYFAKLMKRLHEGHGFAFALFWSPGSRDNPMHPGDDENAEKLIASLPIDFPLIACHTTTLEELIANLAAMDMMITSDGGAMHLGAASGLPTLCFFGNSESARWHPWKVPYKLLQKDTQEVSDISVDEAVEAFEQLYGSLKPSHLT